MLNFDMEKTAIAAIKSGAQSRITDKDFLIIELNKWLTSPLRREMITGDAYYNYEQAIKHRKRMVIVDGGALAEDKNLPNNRIIDNLYAEIIDQKVNYMLSKPLTFKTDEKYNEILKKIFNKKFHKSLKMLGQDVYNCGIGWVYPFYNEEGEFQFKLFRPWEVMPFWKDDAHDELDFAVRVYKTDGYEGRKEVEYTYVELYDTNGITRFTAKRDVTGTITDLIPDYSTYHFELDMDEQFIGYNWTRCPLIAFRASANELPLIKKVKPLQDGLNKIVSDFTNIMEENASGNSVIVLKNYAGTDLGEFRRNLAQYRAVKVKSGGDVGDGGIDTLEIVVNRDNYDAIIKLFRKGIIQNMAGYDYDDLKSSGSPNEMTIKSIFSQIDLSANSLETEFQASFESLLWFVNQHLINTNQGDYTDTDIDVIFNRDLMISESQIITDIKNSVGLISNKTLLSMHPYVSDVDLEIEQMQKEKQENQSKMLPKKEENTDENITETSEMEEEKEE